MFLTLWNFSRPVAKNANCLKLLPDVAQGHGQNFAWFMKATAMTETDLGVFFFLRLRFSTLRFLLEQNTLTCSDFPQFCWNYKWFGASLVQFTGFIYDHIWVRASHPPWAGSDTVFEAPSAQRSSVPPKKCGGISVSVALDAEAWRNEVETSTKRPVLM